MEIKEIINLLEKEKRIKEINLKNRKNNISSSFFFAQLDFKVIENLEDVIETLDFIIEQLKDCQDRIIKRNNERIHQ